MSGTKWPTKAQHIAYLENQLAAEKARADAAERERDRWKERALSLVAEGTTEAMARAEKAESEASRIRAAWTLDLRRVNAEQSRADRFAAALREIAATERVEWEAMRHIAAAALEEEK